MGSVIDMVGLNMYHTSLGVMQQMHRRATGHVEVCITEFGKGFQMPASASFGKSQVWSGGPFPNPVRTANASLSMLASMETLLLALALGGLDAGYQLVADGGAATRTPRRPTFGCEARTAGAPGLRHAAEGGSAFGSFEEDGSDKRADPDIAQGRWRVEASGGSAPWPEPILGTSPPKLTDMSTQQSAPRLQPRLGMGKVRGLRGSGANPQAHSGQADGVELGARVPGPQLPDASGSQGSKGSQESSEGDGYIDELDYSGANGVAGSIANNGANGTTDIVDHAGGFGATDLFDGDGGYGKGMGSDRDSATEPKPRTDDSRRERDTAASARQPPEWKDGCRPMEHRRTGQCSLSSSDIGWRLGGGEGDGASNPGCHDAWLGTDSFVHQMSGGADPQLARGQGTLPLILRPGRLQLPVHLERRDGPQQPDGGLRDSTVPGLPAGSPQAARTEGGWPGDAPGVSTRSWHPNGTM